MTYPNTQLFINGQWQDAADGKSLAVFNPATGQEIGRVAHAGIADLDARAGRRAKRLRDLARPARHRAQQDHAPRRRA
jgi:succinate-semialdehyde dehydrogenase/glutarate-semialdehyde dehydrogenase